MQNTLPKFEPNQTLSASNPIQLHWKYWKQDYVTLSYSSRWTHKPCSIIGADFVYKL